MDAGKLIVAVQIGRKRGNICIYLQITIKYYSFTKSKQI